MSYLLVQGENIQHSRRLDYRLDDFYPPSEGVPSPQILVGEEHHRKPNGAGKSSSLWPNRPDAKRNPQKSLRGKYEEAGDDQGSAFFARSPRLESK